MAVVGLADPCPVYTLLVHLGESRPQPLDTVSLSCRRLLEDFPSSSQIPGGLTMKYPVYSRRLLTPMLRKTVEEGDAEVLVTYF